MSQFSYYYTTVALVVEAKIVYFLQVKLSVVYNKMQFKKGGYVKVPKLKEPTMLRPQEKKTHTGAGAD